MMIGIGIGLILVFSWFIVLEVVMGVLLEIIRVSLCVMFIMVSVVIKVGNLL